MSCPQCIVALAGFGDDTPPTPPDSSVVQVNDPQLAQAAQDVGAGVGALLISPIIGSLGASILGAILWKDHRVLGGLAGLFLGGLAGGAVGVAIAKSKFDDVTSIPWEISQREYATGGNPQLLSISPNLVNAFKIPSLPERTTAEQSSDTRQRIVPALRLGSMLQPAVKCASGQVNARGQCVTTSIKPATVDGSKFKLSTFAAKISQMFQRRISLPHTQKRVALPSQQGNGLVRVVNNTRTSPTLAPLQVVNNTRTPTTSPVSLRIVPNTAPTSAPTTALVKPTAIRF
jgi:hypothetical protein